jgi:hypothetical protein
MTKIEQRDKLLNTVDLRSVRSGTHDDFESAGSLSEPVFGLIDSRWQRP